MSLGRAPDDATPPADLATRPLPLTTIVGPAWRVYPGAHRPLHFNRQDGRFNDPQLQYGVLYAADTDVGAFAERLLLAPGLIRGPLGAANGASVPVSRATLETFALATVTFAQPLTCVDLRTLSGLTQIGAGPWLLAAPHAVSKRWSRPIFLHPTAPEGIVWSSRVGLILLISTPSQHSRAQSRHRVAVPTCPLEARFLKANSD